MRWQHYVARQLPPVTRICTITALQGDRVFAFCNVLITATHGPPLTVHLLLSGRLEGMLGEVLELSDSGTVDRDEVGLLTIAATMLAWLKQPGRMCTKGLHAKRQPAC